MLQTAASNKPVNEKQLQYCCAAEAFSLWGTGGNKGASGIGKGAVCGQARGLDD